MAKLSGLIGSGKVGKADPKVVEAMPAAPEAPEAGGAVGGTEAAPPPPLAAREPDLAVPVLESSAPTAPLPVAAPAEEHGGVIPLPVTRIRASPFQVRAAADSEYIETLMASIVQSGVISPVVVRALDAGAYEVIAGHHRLEACRRLGHAEVPAVVRRMSDAEAACALASDNFVRQELSDYERYKHARMLKDHGFCRTNGAIGQVLGVSRQLVGFLFAFDDYPPGARAVLETHPGILGATQANELKDLAREEPDLFSEAIAQLADGKLRQNQIRGWIEAKFKTSALRMQRRHEIRINRPGLRSPVRLIYTDREAKIQAEGLDIEKLRALIENHLDDLLAP